MTRFRWCPWGFGALLLLVLGYAVGSFVVPNAPRVPIECTVLNDSGEAIEHVAVTVFHRTYHAEALGPGGSFTFAFDAAGDDHYHVEVRSAGGPMRVADVGYVTTGTYPKDRIEIEPDEIRYVTTSR
jgi:hypothetical protein